MSERTIAQRRFVQVTRNNVDLLWSKERLGHKYDDEDRLALREIAYCLAVATEFCFAGKNFTQPIEDFVNKYFVNGTYIEPDEKDKQIEALEQRVQSLERIISQGGPGRGHTK